MDDQTNFYKLIFDTANDPMLIIKENLILLCNAQTLESFGYKEEQMVGKTLEYFSHDNQNVMKWEEMLSAEIRNFEWLFTKATGETFFVEVSWSALEYNDEKMILVILRNCNERLIASENRFKQLVENIKEVFWIHDYDLNKILYISPMYEKIWGNSCSSLYKHPHSLIQSIYQEDQERVNLAFEKMKTMSEDFKEEYRIVRADGAIRWIWARNFPIKNKEGIIYRVVGIAEDITVRKNLEEELLFCATKDGLTGINNRKSFFGQVEAVIETLSVSRYKSTLMMMDIDWYKSINDTYGHTTGDVVLRKFVEICSGQLRPDDIFGRIGGEEFAVFLPNTDVRVGLIVAERIRKSIENTKFSSGQLEAVIHVTVSIGVAGILNEEDAFEQALVRADQSLYKAKHYGRNQVVSVDY